MPVHDWTRVNAGIFHHFHGQWITAISNTLNDGLLPPNFYALGEQVAGSLGPDVLTLQAKSANGNISWGDSPNVTAVAEVPPQVRFTAQATIDPYVLKQRTLVIRHSSDDRIIAFLEILSPGNKANRHALRAVMDKATAILAQGYHLLLIDVHPPTRRDPQGIHGVLWAEISEEAYEAPPGKLLTLAAYSGGEIKTAYVQPIAVGDVLPPMPLFLDPEFYVSVPLEETYQAAWRGVPQRWRTVLENQQP